MVPKGGWKYLQPETQTWISAGNNAELQKKVTEHRAYRGIETINVAQDIEGQLCMVHGEKFCAKWKTEQWEPFHDVSTEIGIQQVKDFSAFVIEKLQSKEPLASKEESEKRAAICRSCPFNKAAPFCACTPFYKAIESLIPEDRKEKDLHICGICGCSLRVKVLMPQGVVEKDNENKQRKYPAHCWQLPHGKSQS